MLSITSFFLFQSINFIIYGDRIVDIFFHFIKAHSNESNCVDCGLFIHYFERWSVKCNEAISVGRHRLIIYAW